MDTLIKYLVDSLQSYESGHGDALCPISKEAEKSFMGDHLRVGPVSTEEYRRRQDLVDEKMAAIFQAISLNITSTHRSRIPQVGIGITETELQSTVRDNLEILSMPPHTFDTTSENSAEFESTVPLPAASPRSTALPKPVPIPGVSISDLGHGSTAWRTAIRQWEDKDPLTGLVGLKYWPREWYTGVMRTHTGAKRSTRKIIAEEYER